MDFKMWINEGTAIDENELLTLLRSLSNIKPMAVHGDCGTFAVAMVKFLEEHGSKSSLGAIVRNSDAEESSELAGMNEPLVAHVFFWFDNKAYDIEGLFTLTKAKEYAKIYGITGQVIGFDASDRNITAIRSETNYSNDWPFYYQKISAANS